MKLKFLFVTAFVVAASASLAQDAPPKKAIQVLPEEIKWVDAPPTLPAGTKIALMEGDPTKEGMFTQRLKVPAGAMVRPHTHPREERVTVLSGAVFVGFGDTIEKTKAKKLPAGSFYVNPPKTHHYAFFEEETVIQITGVAPWAVHYLDEKK